MKIQALSCAEREMEQVEHPLFAAQKGRAQLKHSWMPLDSCSNNCSACSAGHSHSGPWVCRGSGMRSQPRTQIDASNFLAVEWPLCFSGDLRNIVPGWFLACLSEQPSDDTVLTLLLMAVHPCHLGFFCSAAVPEYLCSGSVWSLCMWKYQLKFCPLEQQLRDSFVIQFFLHLSSKFELEVPEIYKAQADWAECVLAFQWEFPAIPICTGFTIRREEPKAVLP